MEWSDASGAQASLVTVELHSEEAVHRHEGKRTRGRPEEARHDAGDQRLLLHLVLEIVRHIASSQIPSLSTHLDSLNEVEHGVVDAFSRDEGERLCVPQSEAVRCAYIVSIVAFQ